MSQAAPTLPAPDKAKAAPLAALWRSLEGVPPERVAFAFVVALGCAVLLPYLGAVGLYDPWESHYAEVAREMVARDDYLHPHWKEHYFFSKPVLLFWMSAIGFKVVDVFTGGITGPGNFPGVTELAARLPVALVALLCLAMVYRFVNRFFGRTAAVLSGVVLATTPFFVMVGRQHITDMPFVGLSTAALCLMAEAFLGTDEEAERPVTRLFAAALLAVTLPQYLQILRSTTLIPGSNLPVRYGAFAAVSLATAGVAWWLLRHGKDSRAHFFYLLCGLAILAKGIAGLALPGLVFLAYVLLTWEWWRLKRIRAVTGTVVLLLVAAPWLAVMSLFPGKDDEGKTFAQRFWVHDHLNRVSGGVHGERGTFEYYVKQLGFGCMPWTGLLPFAWLKLATPEQQPSAEETRARARTFVALWALVCFALFSMSTTKFHHYILPMVPPLAIAAGVFLAELWDTRRVPSLLVVLTMALVSVLVSRDLLQNPHAMVDLFTYHYVSYKPDYYMPTDLPYGRWFLGIGVVAAAVMLLSALLSSAEAVRAQLSRKASGAAEAVRWVVAELVEALLWLGEQATGLVVRPVAGLGGRVFVVGASLCGLAMAYFITDVYLLKLAPHWSQRYLFNTYYSMRQDDEPIIAYLMNWRGETFHSKNREPQINDANALKARLKQPGREFILVETNRYKGMEQALAQDFKGKVNIIDRSNAKWYLVLVDD